MRRLRMRLDAMEKTHRIAPDAGDISEAERKEEDFKENVVEDVAQDHLIRVVLRIGARARIEVPM